MNIVQSAVPALKDHPFVLGRFRRIGRLAVGHIHGFQDRPVIINKPDPEPELLRKQIVDRSGVLSDLFIDQRSAFCVDRPLYIGLCIRNPF